MLASLIARFFSVKMALMSFLLASLCALGFEFIGSSIDSQGILHEPFFLVPIAWLWIFIGLFAGLGALVAKVMASIQLKKTNKETE